ncbi:MAG: L-seryl-tRNA(Sec) selenium transferase [Myxococcota bacterium]|nr:L-seryl-tRNA(Sec) selenium transferase [Myxococcota bacterium]
MDPRSPVNPEEHPDETEHRDARRALPSVDRLARQVTGMAGDLPGWAARAGAREAVAAARAEMARSDPAGIDLATVQTAALTAARRLVAPQPRPVVNATGVVLHTNLGRSPLGAAAAAAAEAAAGYSDLELDLVSGRRGNRLGSLVDKLVLLSGAQAAYACNNNASALLLALDTLAGETATSGLREVIVSRGELVEIGGSFRVPDIMAKAGVRLVEVGSTNRTHLSDYERAIGPNTGMLLKVHRSNFEQSGFVAEVGLGELVGLGRERGIPVVEDLGSGTFVDLRARGLTTIPEETYVPSRVAMGADIVCLSGDKLLGGPQAGLIVGTAEAVNAMKANPLARALRLDKMGIAALDWVLTALLDDRLSEIPVVAQLLEPVDSLEARAKALGAALESVVGGKLDVVVATDCAPVGGGSVPGFELDTWVVELRGLRGASRLAGLLRAAPAPVVTRVRDDAVVFDLRTLGDGDAEAVEAAVQFALTQSA